MFRSHNGFTLVEVMVVVVIIGILTTLAFPRFMAAAAKSRATEFRMVLKQIYALENSYQQENDTYSSDLDAIGADQVGTRSRFLYSVPTVDVATYEAHADLRAQSIATYTGTATLNQAGIGGVQGTLQQISTWRGVGN